MTQDGEREFIEQLYKLAVDPQVSNTHLRQKIIEKYEELTKQHKKNEDSAGKECEEVKLDQKGSNANGTPQLRGEKKNTAAFPTYSPEEIQKLCPTRAEINLDHYLANMKVLRERAGNAEVLAVVKSDGYGHGAVPLAHSLYRHGHRIFGVATLPEALELRSSGIDCDILVFGSALSQNIPVYIQQNFLLSVTTPELAKSAIQVARERGKLRVHIKVDTGMGRVGLSLEEVKEVVKALEEEPNVSVEALWTHMATADQPHSKYAQQQISNFRKILETANTRSYPIHFSNSGALLSLKKEMEELAPSCVRLGIITYGIYPLEENEEEHLQIPLLQVMRLVSTVTQIKVVEPNTYISYSGTWKSSKRTTIATVGAGYADGYIRLLSNRGKVGIRGRLYPVVGNVCMDMFMVDLGEPKEEQEVKVGDDVVLFGEGGPHVEQVAKWAQTIPYEVCCGVTKRVPRIYFGGK